MEQEDARPQRVIVAMKGHPGTGKTTLARFLAASLRCPLLDKDDVRDSTFTIESQLESHTISKHLNDLSYEVIWNMARTQLSLGLNVVIDSPLSRKTHLDRLVDLASSLDGSRLIVVECKPKDEVEWRRRLENRGKDGCGGSWHKPATWHDMEKLLEGYNGCTDYDVLDTTAIDVKVTELVELVFRFIDACTTC